MYACSHLVFLDLLEQTIAIPEKRFKADLETAQVAATRSGCGAGGNHLENRERGFPTSPNRKSRWRRTVHHKRVYVCGT